MFRIGRLARVALAALCMAIPMAFAAPSPVSTPASRPVTLRIGVYDGRAVAFAWVRSTKVGETITKLSADAKAARDAGDQKKYDDLHDQLERLQFAAHAQVFSTARPDEALAKLAPDMPSIAKEAHVSAIVERLDYGDPDVETVDLTEALIARFNPTPEIKQQALELRKTKPVSLYDVARNPD